MRILSALTIIFLLSAYTASAQIKITKTDMPEAGKNYTRSFAVPTSFDLMLDQKGPNQKWDYSSLMPTSQAADTFKSMNQVSQAYKIYFISNEPNLVMPQSLSSLPDSMMPLPLPKSALGFLKNQNSNLSVIGLGFDAMGIPLGVPYESPDVIFSFPLSFKKQDSSFSSYTISFPGLGYYHHDQLRRWVVDGWGHVKTPYGEWDALRVKTIIDEQDTVYLDTLGTGSRLYPPTTVEYQWLANGLGQAVMTISGNEFNGNFLPTEVSYMDTPWAASVRLPDNYQSAQISAYPNPVREECQVANPFQYAVQAELLDLSGRRIRSLSLMPGNNTLPMNELCSGTYILRVQGRFGVQSLKLSKL